MEASEILSEKKISPGVQRLVTVARDEFIRLGYEAVSIDGIARAANMSKETIYRHFDGKEALFAQAVQSMNARFSNRTLAVSALCLPPEEALLRHAVNIGAAAGDDGFLSVVWLAISAARDMPHFSNALRADYTARLEPVRQDLARAVPAGRTVTLEHAEDFGSMIAGGAKHVMGGLRGDPGDHMAALEAHARRIIGLVLHGCRTEALQSPQMLPAFPGTGLLILPAPRSAHLATLLDVAIRQFAERGYHQTNLDSIGMQARVGRGTLYRHFKNKAGLFEAAMITAARRITQGAQWAAMPGGDPVDGLRACLESAAAALTSHASIALHRTVIAEAHRAPDLAQNIYGILRDPWMRPLTAWFQQAAEQGFLAMDAPESYAEAMLVVAAKGNRPAISGMPLTPAECAEGAGRAIHMLLP